MGLFAFNRNRNAKGADETQPSAPLTPKPKPKPDKKPDKKQE